MTTANPQHGILVGVDGFPYSEAALRWAVREAMMRNKRLSIVNVISPLIGGWSGVGMSGAALPQDLERWQEEHAQQVIENAERIGREAAPDVNLQISTDTPFAQLVPTLIDLSGRAD